MPSKKKKDRFEYENSIQIILDIVQGHWFLWFLLDLQHLSLSPYSKLENAEGRKKG